MRGARKISGAAHGAGTETRLGLRILGVAEEQGRT
jgi:hypothetical protein